MSPSTIPSPRSQSHELMKHSSLHSAPMDHLDIFIGLLPGFTKEFQESTPGELVHQYFKKHPMLPGILIMRERELLGMLTRALFFQLLSRPQSEFLYLAQPISRMLEEGKVETTPLSHDTGVNASIAWCLSRSDEHIYDPIVVSLGHSYKIVHFHELIIAQAKLLDEKMNEVMDSIIYAERIQKSMLRGHEQLDHPRVGMSVLFRPRDIISGDFYWTCQTATQIIVAVADCTGHGVPGAFMSLLGHNFLDDIVLSKGVTEPDWILHYLHENIRRRLNQSNEERGGRDGMDVCLCVIDVPSRKLRFSGAKRPIFFTTTDGDLYECRGDRFSIGGLQREKKRVFTSHEIDLHQKLTFYLTTDGYVDQPSETGQKFGTPRLRSILKEMCGLPFPSKKSHLEAVLDNHKRNRDQRDDITVIALEWRGE